MAFTKAPEYNTHQQDFIPVGGDIKTYPFLFDNGPDWVLKNALVLKNDSSLGVVPVPPIVHDSVVTDALRTYYGSGYVTNRGTYAGNLNSAVSPVQGGGTWIPMVVENDLFFYTPGDSLYLGAANQYSEFTSSIGWADYAVGSTQYIISNEVRAGPSPTNTFRIYDETLALLYTTDVDFRVGLGGVGLPDIVFLDGYLFAACGLTRQRIYNSTLGAPQTWNVSVDFLDSESSGDALVGLAKHHNHLVAFGTNTIEFFYNAGNELGSPLQRQSSYAVNLGSYYEQLGQSPKCTIGDVIYFAGGYSGNFAGIYKIENFKVEKISPDWLDTVLNRGSEDAVSQPVGRFAFSPVVKPARFGTKSGIIVNTNPGNAQNIPQSYFYDTKTGIWTYLTLFDSAYNSSTEVTTYGLSFLPRQFNASDTNSKAAYVCNDDFYNSLGEFTDQGGYYLVTSAWKTPPLNMKNFNDKHFYSVEVIGSFPNNDITLYIEEDQMRKDFTNKANLQTKLQTKKSYHQNPLIWRNLGRFRNPRITVEISGTNNYRLDGIVVKYNEGTK